MERVYKIMGNTGAANIAIGIVIIVIGVAAGIISIVCGAKLVKGKKGLIF